MNRFGYRFGFNGKENENEWDGQTGSKLNFDARIYDSRIGKFLSIDPQTNEYPQLTPYNFVNNNPILLIDPTGEVFIIHDGGKSITFRRFGIYIFSSKFIRQSARAIRFSIRRGRNDKIPKNRALVVHKADYVVNIRDSQKDEDGSVEKYGRELGKTVYYSENNTLYWNPKRGTQEQTYAWLDNCGRKTPSPAETDKVNSPRMGVLHEIGHGYSYNEDPIGFKERIENPDAMFDDGEELDNYKNWEMYCLKKEPGALSHAGLDINVPNMRFFINPFQKKSNARKKKIIEKLNPKKGT